MSLVTELVCVSCNRSYLPDQAAYTCPACGGKDGILDVRYDLSAVNRTLSWDSLHGRSQSHWRYRELLPLDEVPDWPVGWTPIVPAPRLAAEVGVGSLRLKDEGRNPTASFKDRASSVAVVKACGERVGTLPGEAPSRPLRQKAPDTFSGTTTIACASTGNAASSLAGHAAMAGLGAVIFVPNSAPEPKIAQLLVYGATVFRVHGTYAQAYDLCMSACEAFGWYNRNCAINPYLVEGKKTGGMEIAEQCREHPPDWVVVSVGDGCTIAGVGKGLRQMRELGLIDWQPRLLGVQAASVDPVARAFHGEPADQDRFKHTLADSIDVPVPRNLRKAVLAVRESDGAFVEVSDQAILAAVRQTGRLAGVFAEPAAAAAVAGVHAAARRGIIAEDASVLAVITGSGLKDVHSAMEAAGRPIDIAPDLNAVRQVVEG